MVVNPSINASWFGTSVGTQTQTIALGVINGYADYPRNLKVICRGVAGSVVGGTVTINGKDQFGSVIQETITITPIIAGGTTNGTKIFSQVTSGTTAYGTGDAGNGTTQVGVGTAGTTTLFGLPFKIGGTSDIKQIAMSAVGTSTAGTFVYGGTPSSAAVVGVHAFRAPVDFLGGSTSFNVVAIPTYDSSSDGPITTLGTNTGASAISTTG
jgi:hypothetical protein